MSTVIDAHDIALKDNLLIVEYIDGCILQYQGVVTEITPYGEITLNETFTMETYPTQVIIKLTSEDES